MARWDDVVIDDLRPVPLTPAEAFLLAIAALVSVRALRALARRGRVYVRCGSR